MKGNCQKCPIDKSCTENECDWYINNPSYFNCFQVFKYFINKPYTLQEIAKMMNTSHTSIKMIETKALEKLKLASQENDEILKELKQLIQKDDLL